MPTSGGNIQRLFSIAFSITTTLFAVSCVTPSSAEPDGSLSSIEHIRDDFLAAARRDGANLSFVPEMREWTRPSLISWRQEQKCVAVPGWDELPEGARSAIEKMAGTNDSQKFFRYLFRWFQVPHELTHAIQVNLAPAVNHSASERAANDLAVAFFMRDEGNSRRLEELEVMLRSASKALPDVRSFGKNPDDYFNSHYDELGANPESYGAFQVSFILDSLRRRHTLDFDRLVTEIRQTGRVGGKS